MRRKGFTLIELVMVIVIIGILAAVAIPKFMSLKDEAELARCKADVGAIRTGISGWYAKYHANNSVCPVTGQCSAEGFPSAINTQFAGYSFADGALPPATHLTGSVGNWTDAYNSTTGILNMTDCCGSE